MTDQELMRAARDARARAYAPYSHFAVGAALACTDGTIVTGTNVENACYGLSMCAERSAVFAAVAAGRSSFEAIAVAGPTGSATPPCGACRQVLCEFGVGIRVIYATPSGCEATTVAALLPAEFVLP